MIDWFLSGGLVMWPLAALALGVWASAVRAVVRLRSAARAVADAADPTAPALESRDHALVAVLFWGAVALLVGAIGTVTGLVILARRAAAAGGASTELIMGGVSIALNSLGFGILIFLLSAVLWLVLDAWRRRVVDTARRVASVCILLGLAGIAAGCGGADASRFVASDSAGIRLATSFGPDRPYPATLVRLGSLQPPDSALSAMPWGVVADPESGRIFVADGTSERVVVFEAGGTYAFTIGRPGEGPGEFRSATALALDRAGVLSVWDARRGVISRWSRDGELLDERRAPVNYWGPGFAVLGDGIVAVTQSTTENVQRQSLVHVAGAGEPGEVFGVSRELVHMNLAGMSVPAPRIFAPDLIWNAAGDTILVLNGPEYRIDAYVAGRQVRSIRRDLEPIAVTAELAAQRVGAGPYRGFMRRAGLTAEQVVAAIGYEATASPIEWITVSPSGELWVSRGSGLPIPERVDVFAPDGRYVGTFDAPGFPVAFVSDSIFVALEISELGEPVLGLYRLDNGTVARALVTGNPVLGLRGSGAGTLDHRRLGAARGTVVQWGVRWESWTLLTAPRPLL